MKGYSQEFMAEQLSISQRSYSKLEREEIKLDWPKIESIATIFEIKPTELISLDENFIFNNSPQSGKFNTNEMHNHFPEELKKQYELRIDHLEQEVRFLRNQLDKKP